MTDREKFEAWVGSKSHRADRDAKGDYVFAYTATAWEAWQAALASQQPADDLVQRALAAEGKLYAQENIIPDGLNRSTADMVLGFAKALAEKLHRSEQKYGWSDGWKESDWQEKCLADFHHHISKGDPRDVAAYCAFMWHHDWKTSSPQQPADDGWIEWGGGERPVGDGREVAIKFRDGTLISETLSDCWVWSHSGDYDDIIAYRVVKP